jgi:hypothetical protein
MDLHNMCNSVYEEASLEIFSNLDQFTERMENEMGTDSTVMDVHDGTNNAPATGGGGAAAAVAAVVGKSDAKRDDYSPNGDNVTKTIQDVAQYSEYGKGKRGKSASNEKSHKGSGIKRKRQPTKKPKGEKSKGGKMKRVRKSSHHDEHVIGEDGGGDGGDGGDGSDGGDGNDEIANVTKFDNAAAIIQPSTSETVPVAAVVENEKQNIAHQKLESIKKPGNLAKNNRWLKIKPLVAKTSPGNINNMATESRYFHQKRNSDGAFETIFWNDKSDALLSLNSTTIFENCGVAYEHIPIQKKRKKIRVLYPISRDSKRVSTFSIRAQYKFGETLHVEVPFKVVANNEVANGSNATMEPLLQSETTRKIHRLRKRGGSSNWQNAPKKNGSIESRRTTTTTTTSRSRSGDSRSRSSSCLGASSRNSSCSSISSRSGSSCSSSISSRSSSSSSSSRSYRRRRKSSSSSSNRSSSSSSNNNNNNKKSKTTPHSRKIDNKSKKYNYYKNPQRTKDQRQSSHIQRRVDAMYNKKDISRKLHYNNKKRTTKSKLGHHHHHHHHHNHRRNRRRYTRKRSIPTKQQLPLVLDNYLGPLLLQVLQIASDNEWFDKQNYKQHISKSSKMGWNYYMNTSIENFQTMLLKPNDSVESNVYDDNDDDDYPSLKPDQCYKNVLKWLKAMESLNVDHIESMAIKESNLVEFDGSFDIGKDVELIISRKKPTHAGPKKTRANKETRGRGDQDIFSNKQVDDYEDGDQETVGCNNQNNVGMVVGYWKSKKRFVYSKMYLNGLLNFICTLENNNNNNEEESKNYLNVEYGQGGIFKTASCSIALYFLLGFDGLTGPLCPPMAAIQYLPNLSLFTQKNKHCELVWHLNVLKSYAREILKMEHTSTKNETGKFSIESFGASALRMITSPSLFFPRHGDNVATCSAADQNGPQKSSKRDPNNPKYRQDDQNLILKVLSSTTFFAGTMLWRKHESGAKFYDVDYDHEDVLKKLKLYKNPRRLGILSAALSGLGPKNVDKNSTCCVNIESERISPLLKSFISKVNRLILNEGVCYSKRIKKFGGDETHSGDHTAPTTKVFDQNLQGQQQQQQHEPRNEKQREKRQELELKLRDTDESDFDAPPPPPIVDEMPMTTRVDELVLQPPPFEKPPPLVDECSDEARLESLREEEKNKPNDGVEKSIPIRPNLKQLPLHQLVASQQQQQQQQHKKVGKDEQTDGIKSKGGNNKIEERQIIKRNEEAKTIERKKKPSLNRKREINKDDGTKFMQKSKGGNVDVVRNIKQNDHQYKNRKMATGAAAKSSASAQTSSRP